MHLSYQTCPGFATVMVAAYFCDYLANPDNATSYHTLSLRHIVPHKNPNRILLIGLSFENVDNTEKAKNLKNKKVGP